MQKSIAKNYIYNTVYQILQIIVPLITTPYISRVLGVDNVGIYNYTYTVAYYFVVVAQLGISLYGRREISIVRDEKDTYSLLFKQLVAIRWIAFAMAIAIYACFIELSSKYTTYYLIYLIYIIANAIDITWFFQAFEEFRIITIRNIVVKLLNTACLFVFVKSGDDLWIYILLYAVGEFLSQLIMWLNIGKKVSKVKFTTIGMSEHLKGAIVMFLPQIITTIYTLADKLILGFFSTETHVGLYSQSERIVKLTLSIISSLGLVVMPRIANLAAKKNEDVEINRLLCRSRDFVWFLALPMIAGLIGISDNFTAWFFGDGYSDVAYLMCIISPIILLIGLSDLYGMQYLVPSGHMREYTISAAAGAMVNVILNLILVHNFAAAGVSFATVVSEFTVTFLMWIFSRKYIRLSKPIPCLYVIDALIMGVCIKIIDHFMPEKIFSTCIEICIGVVIYIGVLLLKKDAFTLDVLMLLKKKVFKEL